MSCLLLKILNISVLLLTKQEEEKGENILLPRKGQALATGRNIKWSADLPAGYIKHYTHLRHKWKSTLSSLSKST